MDEPRSTDIYERLIAEYALMAADEAREAEALEWAEALIDLDD